MIIVTSGHVDHGKTALLQALTGTSTAHLPEEKKRGMTIDLGYAYLPLDDRILGFIDVPGHEKFLANMLAGLGGIHYAMLIVAADEGIRAQTQEHLAILRLLQIELILVITKADRAEPSQIERLCRRLRQDFPYLAASECFITSARTGQGIAELRNYLAALPNPAERDKPFRYAVDRAFSLKGAGLVVTGTAFGGRVETGETLYLSSGEKARVKNIHAQNRQTDIGLAGQRLALNLGLDFDRRLIGRGDWLLAQKPPAPTDRISIRVTAEQALQESQPVHIYHAAARTVGKLTLLSAKNLAPTEQGLAELILDRPLLPAYGDRLILRSGDNKRLLAGAQVLEINSPKRHKRSEMRLNFLRVLQETQHSSQRVALYLQAGAVPTRDIMWTEQLDEAQLTDILAQNHDVHFQDWCFNAGYQAQKNTEILTALSDYHAQHGDQLGLSKARLYRIAALNQPEKLIYHFIERLLADGKLQQTRGWLHLPEHQIRFSAAEFELWRQVLDEFGQRQGQALWVRELAEILAAEEEAMRSFLYKAGKLGYLTAVVKDRFFLTEDIYRYAGLIKKIIAKQGSISVNQLRDELRFGRKLTVQLMEYFDRCGFLRRKGNTHILRDGEVFDS